MTKIVNNGILRIVKKAILFILQKVIVKSKNLWFNYLCCKDNKNIGGLNHEEGRIIILSIIYNVRDC